MLKFCNIKEKIPKILKKQRDFNSLNYKNISPFPIMDQFGSLTQNIAL